MALKVGHADWNAPVDASKGMDEHDALATMRPNVDCLICDKAKFKTGTFKRNPIDEDKYYPPF